MRKSCVTIFLIIAIMLSMTACHKQSPTVTPKPSDSVEPTQTDSASPTPAEQPGESISPEPTETVSPEETARLEREQLELQRKEQDKEFYVPLKPLDKTGQKPDGDDIRALYLVDSVLTKNHGSQEQPDWRFVRCEDANVQLYKTYVEALAANNTEKINELKYLQGSLTVLERVIGIILGTEMNAVVLNIKSGDGVITMPMQAECIKQVQTEPPDSATSGMYSIYSKATVFIQ